MNVFAATPSTSVDIVVSSARVDVTAVTSHEVSVHVTPTHVWRASDRRAAERIEVHSDEDRVIVTSPQRSLGELGSAIVSVSVPVGTAISAHTGNGAIRLLGPIGDAEVHAANGAVHVEEVRCVKASTTSGAVWIRRCHGRAELSTASGALRLDHAASADLRTTNGSIRIDQATGDVQATSSNGSIKVAHADGEVTLESHNGSIRVASAEGGRLRAQADNGKISVGVAQEVSAWVDASTRHGRVDNRLSPGQGPLSERTVELHLHSGAGSVVLDRSEPAAA